MDRTELTASELRPAKRPDIVMLTTILDELAVTLKVLQSGKGELDDYQCQRIIASREYDGIADMYDEIPNFEGWRQTHWEQMREDHWYPPHTQHIPFDHQTIVKYLQHAFELLQQTLSTQKDFDKQVFSDIQEIYNSQGFCQLCQPLYQNPVLANELRKQRQLMLKKH